MNVSYLLLLTLLKMFVNVNKTFFEIFIAETKSFKISLLPDCWVGWKREGDTCVKCPIGTFQAYGTPRVCEPCPEGSTRTEPGSTECSMFITFIEISIKNHVFHISPSNLVQVKIMIFGSDNHMVKLAEKKTIG